MKLNILTAFMGYLCWMIFGTVASVSAQAIVAIGNTGEESFPFVADFHGKLIGATAFGADGGGDGNEFNSSYTGPVTLGYHFDGQTGSLPNGVVVANGRVYCVVRYGPGHHTDALLDITDATSDHPPSVAYQFTGGDDGVDVEGIRVSRDGKSIFGTSYSGGKYGYGVTWQFILPTASLLHGKMVIRHSYQGYDGRQPGASPYEEPDGTLYVTAGYGGTYDGGTFGKISPDDVFTLLNSLFPLHSGPGNIAKGPDGQFYISLTNGSQNGGLVGLTPQGAVTYTYTWSNGSYLTGDLINVNGLMYGTIRNDFLGKGLGQGAVICFNPATKTVTTVKQLAGHPLGGPIIGSDGNLYFTTDEGDIYKIILQSPQLVNISTRLDIGTGANVLIGGFIITGSQPKEVMVRAIGPSLSADKVAGALADPTLELHNQSGALIASNDDWDTSNQKAEIASSKLEPGNSKESAIMITLAPGAYTAIVQGKGDTTGIGLVEVYDLDPGAGSELANISTRGLVQSGDDVMIGGLTVTGGLEKVIIRAIGPSLKASGIANALQDPTLELHDGNGNLLESNDNWQSDQKAAIMATNLAPSDDAESAIIATLAPGAYTAIVRGANNSTGIGLVEAYQLSK